MNEPRLRFKGFKDEWKKSSLYKKFSKINNAFVGKASPYYTDKEKGHFYLESNNVKNGVINTKSMVFINDYFYKKQKDKLLHYKDIVMVQSGHVGQTAIINKDLDGTAAHALIMMRGPIQTNSIFINTLFQSNTYKNKISLITTGNTIKHILASDINKLTIFSPSLNEQQKIGSFFEKLDQLIQLQYDKLEHLKETKKGYLKKILVNKFNNKNNWKSSKLKKLVNIQTGKLDANAMTPNGKYDFYTSGKKVYKINSYIFDGNAITIAGNGANVGFMHLARGKFNAYQRTYVLNDFQIDWIYIFFIIKVKMRKLIYNNSRNGNIPYIVLGDLQNLNIEYPNIKEQQKIGQFFSNLDQQITLQQQKLDNLKQQKKAYLQKMFI